MEGQQLRHRNLLLVRLLWQGTKEEAAGTTATATPLRRQRGGSSSSGSSSSSSLNSPINVQQEEEEEDQEEAEQQYHHESHENEPFRVPSMTMDATEVPRKKNKYKQRENEIRERKLLQCSDDNALSWNFYQAWPRFSDDEYDDSEQQEQSAAPQEEEEGEATDRTVRTKHLAQRVNAQACYTPRYLGSSTPDGETDQLSGDFEEAALLDDLVSRVAESCAASGGTCASTGVPPTSQALHGFVVAALTKHNNNSNNNSSDGAADTSSSTRSFDIANTQLVSFVSPALTEVFAQLLIPVVVVEEVGGAANSATTAMTQSPSSMSFAVFQEVAFLHMLDYLREWFFCQNKHFIVPYAPPPPPPPEETGEIQFAASYFTPTSGMIKDDIDAARITGTQAEERHEIQLERMDGAAGGVFLRAESVREEETVQPLAVQGESLGRRARPKSRISDITIQAAAQQFPQAPPQEQKKQKRGAMWLPTFKSKIAGQRMAKKDRIDAQEAKISMDETVVGRRRVELEFLDEEEDRLSVSEASEASEEPEEPEEVKPGDTQAVCVKEEEEEEDAEAAAQRRREAEEKEKEREKEKEIDEMFADLETLVKYLGDLLFAATKKRGWPAKCECLYRPIRIIAATLIALVVCIAILLPTFFAVLVIRMVKVEVTKESFVKRAAIIAAETVQKHVLRIFRLFARSLPLSSLIIVFPPVLFFAIMGNAGDASSLSLRQNAAFYGVMVFVTLISILQIQGTVRAIITFGKSEEAKLTTHCNAAVVIQRKWKALSAMRLHFSELRMSKLQQLGGGSGGCGGVLGAFHLALAKLGPKWDFSMHRPRFLPPQLHLEVAAPACDVGCFALAAPTTTMINVRGLGGEVVLPSLSVPSLLPQPPVFRPFSLPRLSALECAFFEAPEVPGCSFRSLVVFLSQALEAIQLTTLGMRMVMMNISLPNASWYDLHLLSVVFVRFPDPGLVSAWIAVGVVALLVLVISFVMILEMIRYKKLQHDAEFYGAAEEDADGYLFHSFVGSILYGHGNPKNVSGALCAIVALICDAFFLSIIANLCAAFNCFPWDSTIEFGTTGNITSTNTTANITANLTATAALQHRMPDLALECWGFQHRLLATFALMCVGFYVPLSIMVAPVLAEANKSAAQGSVTLSKPYLMVLNVAKVVAFLVIAMASSRMYPSVLAALGLSGFVALVTSVWCWKTSFAQPCSSKLSNMVRVSTSIGAVLCTVFALVVASSGSVQPHRWTGFLVVAGFCNVLVPLILVVAKFGLAW